MKILVSLRRAAVGAASLLVLAAAAVAQLPKVQLGLVADLNSGSNTGVVHRVDVRTGKYLGAFGAGLLNAPRAVTVDPASKTALVADAVGLKRFDVSTGRLLATLQRNAAYGNLPILALRVVSNGSLYAIVEPTSTTYRILQLDPSTGAVLRTSSAPSFVTIVSGSPLTVGTRANGRVEAIVTENGTIADFYSATTLAYITSTGISVRDRNDLRVVNDGFLRLTNTAVLGGAGDLGSLSFDGSNAGTSLLTVSNPVYGDFAEGGNNLAYLFLQPNASTLQLASFDTSGTPLYNGTLTLTNFSHGTFTDFAIFEK